MGIIAWLKKLKHSKIEIKITIIEPGVRRRVTSPTVEVVTAPMFVRKQQSNFRFVSVHTVEHDGTEKTWYCTEEYKDGRWSHCSDTLAGDKDKAMRLHLKYIEQGTLDPTKTKTVYWEGLAEDEVKTWVLTQLKPEEDDK